MSLVNAESAKQGPVFSGDVTGSGNRLKASAASVFRNFRVYSNMES